MAELEVLRITPRPDQKPANPRELPNNGVARRVLWAVSSFFLVPGRGGCKRCVAAAWPVPAVPPLGGLSRRGDSPPSGVMERIRVINSGTVYLWLRWPPTPAHDPRPRQRRDSRAGCPHRDSQAFGDHPGIEHRHRRQFFQHCGCGAVGAERRARPPSGGHRLDGLHHRCCVPLGLLAYAAEHFQPSSEAGVPRRRVAAWALDSHRVEGCMVTADVTAQSHADRHGAACRPPGVQHSLDEGAAGSAVAVVERVDGLELDMAIAACSTGDGCRNSDTPPDHPGDRAPSRWAERRRKRLRSGLRRADPRSARRVALPRCFDHECRKSILCSPQMSSSVQTPPSLIRSPSVTAARTCLAAPRVRASSSSVTGRPLDPCNAPRPDPLPWRWTPSITLERMLSSRSYDPIRQRGTTTGLRQRSDPSERAVRCCDSAHLSRGQAGLPALQRMRDIGTALSPSVASRSGQPSFSGDISAHSPILSRRMSYSGPWIGGLALLNSRMRCSGDWWLWKPEAVFRKRRPGGADAQEIACSLSVRLIASVRNGPNSHGAS